MSSVLQRIGCSFPGKDNRETSRCNLGLPPRTDLGTGWWQRVQALCDAPPLQRHAGRMAAMSVCPYATGDSMWLQEMAAVSNYNSVRSFVSV